MIETRPPLTPSETPAHESETVEFYPSVAGLSPVLRNTVNLLGTLLDRVIRALAGETIHHLFTEIRQSALSGTEDGPAEALVRRSLAPMQRSA